MTQVQFDKIIRKKMKEDTKQSFHYFWGSFVLQIITYAFLCNVIVRYFGNGLVMIPSLVAIIVYIPFTVVLMRKFKAIAVLKDSSIKSYIQKQHELLESFYKFKKRYEILLIPVASFVGMYLSFELWNPGRIWHMPYLILIIYGITLLTCYLAWRKENKKSFDIPLSKLRLILEDLND